MKKEFTQKKKIHMGFVLEANESEEASSKSYDDMNTVGTIRLVDCSDDVNGDDLNDAPYNCNGSIYSGETISLEKGDMVIIIKK
jgi:hypothetical protein